jgi:hypothetical protein
MAVAAYAIDLAEQLSQLARDSGLGALAQDLRQASDTGRSVLLEMIRERLPRH